MYCFSLFNFLLVIAILLSVTSIYKYLDKNQIDGDCKNSKNSITLVRDVTDESKSFINFLNLLFHRKKILKQNKAVFFFINLVNFKMTGYTSD